jgi:peptidyl-prolyl cis-trans isomerase C
MKLCLLCLSAAAAIFGQTPNPAANQSPVVGTVDGRNITVADVQKMLASSEPGFAQYFRQQPADAVSRFLMLQFLAEEAEKRKLAEDPLVQQQLQAARTKILQQAVVDDERNNFAISNETLAAYYNDHKAQYQLIRIKAIYIPFKADIRVTNNNPEAVRAAAQAAFDNLKVQRSEAEAGVLAAEIVKKLRDGLDFSKAVEQYSEDPASKAVGGDYGFLKAESAFSAEFRTAALALKPGDISEPIRQPAGYYIIRGEEKTDRSLPEVADEIAITIRNDHMNDWLKSKTDQFKFTVKDSKLLQNISAPGVPPPLLSAPQQK